MGEISEAMSKLRELQYSLPIKDQKYPFYYERWLITKNSIIPKWYSRTYTIDKNRINSATELLDWCHHLANKTWITMEDYRALMTIFRCEFPQYFKR